MANNNIALLAKVPDLPTADERETSRLNVQTLRDAATVRTQAMADDAATRQVYANNADPADRLKALYSVNPKAAMAAEKFGVDLGKDKATTAKTEIEGVNLRTARYKDALSTIMDRDSAANWVKAMYADPDIGKHIAQELGPAEAAIARIPDPTTNPQGFAAWKRGSQLGAEKLAEISKPVIGNRDLGGTVQTTATDPFTGVPTVTASNVKTQTPDSVASNARMATEGSLNRANQLAVQDRMTARQDSRNEGVGASLSDDTIQRLAEMELNGDRSGRSGIGRGAQGATNLVAVQNAITRVGAERGVSARDITAASASLEGLRTGMRATGNTSARVENAAEEATQLAPLALAASKEVTRSGFLPFGKAQIMFDTQTNDPALSRFATANTGLATAYASAMARGGKATVSDNEHARKLLAEAKDQPAYEATVGQLLKEIDAAKRAPRVVRDSLSGEIAGKDGHGSQKLKTGTPNTNAQGWALHVDGKGNKAYVSPDGAQFQEVK